MAESPPVDLRQLAHAWAQGRLPPPPCTQTLGVQFLEVADGYCRLRFPVREEYKQSEGVVQGGFLAAMLDDCLGVVAHTVMNPGQSHATIELKVNYLRPATQGWLIGEGRVIRKGAQTLFAEATLTTEEGELIAKASTTFLIRPGRRTPK